MGLQISFVILFLPVLPAPLCSCPYRDFEQYFPLEVEFLAGTTHFPSGRVGVRKEAKLHFFVELSSDEPPEGERADVHPRTLNPDSPEGFAEKVLLRDCLVEDFFSLAEYLFRLGERELLPNCRHLGDKPLGGRVANDLNPRPGLIAVEVIGGFTIPPNENRYRVGQSCRPDFSPPLQPYTVGVPLPVGVEGEISNFVRPIIPQDDEDPGDARGDTSARVTPGTVYGDDSSNLSRNGERIELFVSRSCFLRPREFQFG